MSDENEDGTSATNTLLLTPPADVAEREGCVARMTSPSSQRENALVITYTETPDEVADRLHARLDEEPKRLGIVSVNDGTRSVRELDTPDRLSPVANLAVTAVQDPDDPEPMLNAVDLFLDDWRMTDRRTIACFNSITSLLRYVDLDRAYDLLSALVDRFERARATAHFHFNPRPYGDRVLERVQPLFDTVAGDLFSDGADDFPTEMVYGLLRNPRRAYALRYLYEADGAAALRELVETVAAMEVDTTTGSVTSDQYDRIHTALAGAHLPRLETAGLIEYGSGRSVIRLTDAAQRDAFLRTQVERAVDRDRS